MGSRDDRRGLALSGGGYRASLFHVGALWRLNELGWLPRLDEITSVSAGSICAAYLGLRWKDLEFDDDGVARNFRDAFVSPMRALCSTTIDARAIAGGILKPFGSVAGRLESRRILASTREAFDHPIARRASEAVISPLFGAALAGLNMAARMSDLSPFPSPSERLAAAYDRLLFHGRTMQDLPDSSVPGNPRFTLYATNMQTGSSVRIARDYLTDQRLGGLPKPRISLATAVAASSGFPPFFVPVEVKLNPKSWVPLAGADLYQNDDLKRRLDLADGGIYDNLALERAWTQCKTVLVSDASKPLRVVGALPFDWVRQGLRTAQVLADQVSKLRKRMLIDGLKRGQLEDEPLTGCYWGLGTAIGNYRMEEDAPPLVRDSERTRALSRIRTRLSEFSATEQDDLINWGYALADTGMRRHVTKDAPGGRLPCPDHLR